MKKFFKYTLIVLASIISLIIIALIVFKVRNEIYIGSSDKEFVEYLNNHKKVFDDGNLPCDSLTALFSDDIYQSNFIFLGENHGYAEVQDIDKSLLLHFNKKMGVRYYVAEMDSTTAGMLNTFLQAEVMDTLLLKDVVMRVKQRIMQQAGWQLFDKWCDIYAYNQTLPDSLKITVLGIDMDIDDKSGTSRETAMTENFLRMVKEKGLENERFYAFFGLFHTLQSGVNTINFQPMAARLKAAGFNVKSIVCFDVDSDVYMPKESGYPVGDDEKTTLMSMDGPIVLVKGINDLKKAGRKNSVTLFNLEGEDSPYKSNLKLLQFKMNFIDNGFIPYNENASTLDYIQYAILLRNCNAITPIK